MNLIKKFPCSQQELYAACTAGWSSCKQHLERFTNLRPRYTEAFIEGKLSEIRSTSQLPDRHMRASEQGYARIDLKKQVTRCLDKWKQLRGAIEEFWPEAEQENALRGAGAPYYRDSLMMKWESCSNLLENAAIFIQVNLVKLSAPEVLGPKFSEDFNAEMKGFMMQHQTFLLGQNNILQSAEEKMKANNKLYTDLLAMFKDARIIFKNEPGILKQFVFDGLINRIAGIASAGIKGTVSNGLLPVSEIVGLKLMLAETNEEAITDDDGAYRFSRVPVGIYTVKVSALGYKSQEIPSVAVKPSTYTTLNIKLEPEPPDSEKKASEEGATVK